MLVGLGCLIVIVGIGTGLTGGKFSASSPGSPAGSARAAGSAATRPKSPAAGSGSGRSLTYSVTGSRGAVVTYGPAGSSFTGQAPLRVTTRLGHSRYYSLAALRPGRGPVRCEILIGSKVVSESAATGGHRFAACQISRDPRNGKWQDTDGG